MSLPNAIYCHHLIFMSACSDTPLSPQRRRENIEGNVNPEENEQQGKSLINVVCFLICDGILFRMSL